MKDDEAALPDEDEDEDEVSIPELTPSSYTRLTVVREQYVRVQSKAHLKWLIMSAEPGLDRNFAWYRVKDEEYIDLDEGDYQMVHQFACNQTTFHLTTDGLTTTPDSHLPNYLLLLDKSNWDVNHPPNDTDFRSRHASRTALYYASIPYGYKPVHTQQQMQYLNALRGRIISDQLSWRLVNTKDPYQVIEPPPEVYAAMDYIGSKHRPYMETRDGLFTVDGEYLLLINMTHRGRGGLARG
jgi:hypothetical protein